MLVTIDILIIVPLICLCFGSLAFMMLFFTQLKQYAPEAFRIRYARIHKTGLVCMHHPNGTFELLVPKYDNSSADGYWYVKDHQYKFTDVSGEKIERMSGDLPVHHVMDNLPESISVRMAAHIDHLADVLSERGYYIDGIEKIFFYVLTEIFKKQPLITHNTKTWKDLTVDDQITELLSRLETTLTEIGINDEATRGKLRVIIPYIMKNRDELEGIVRHMRPKPFSFQSTIRAIDNLVAFTSSNLYNTKLVIEADAKNNKGLRDYMPIMVFGLVAFVILIGAGFLLK